MRRAAEVYKHRMELFAVIFNDKSDLGALQTRQLHARFEWVDARKGRVPVAGLLRQETGDVPMRGCWMVRPGSRVAVTESSHTDPFCRSGLPHSVKVPRRSRAVPRHRSPL